MESDMATTTSTAFKGRSDQAQVLINAIKLFIKQYACYVSERSDTNLISLQNQLDAISNCSLSDAVSELYCDSHYLVVTEFVSTLITLLNDPDIKYTIADKIFSISLKWVVSPALQWLLKTAFHLPATLVTFLVDRHSDAGTDRMISKCLDLLKTLTYDLRIGHADVYVDNLLKYLLSNLQKESPASELTLACLVILANISHRNTIVQKKIRNMEGANSFYRSIVNKIGTPSNDLLQVAALSTFANLAVDEEIGSKLFQSKEFIRTLQLVFHKVTINDLDVQCFALDVLIDLLAEKKIQHILLEYEYLTICLSKILLLLTTESDSRIVCKVYELLLFVGSQAVLSQTVKKALLEAESTGVGQLPIVVALYWISSPAQKLWNPSVWAAGFIVQLFNYSDGSSSSLVQDHLDDILGRVSDCFNQCYNVHEVMMGDHLEKMVASLKLLLVLCRDKNYAAKVVQILRSDCICDIMRFLVGHWNLKITNYGSREFISNDFNCEIVDAVLHLLLIMVDTKSSNNGIEGRLYEFLQDLKLMPMFAYALHPSNSQKRISQALKLLFLGSKLQDFPILRLAEAIQNVKPVNKQKQCQMSAVGDDRRRQADVPFCENGVSSCALDAHNAECITNLIDRFKETVNTKDIKSSEIMEMYEHKILSLEMKEKHLQGLMDAKANALQHADRLLIEYRSRWARSDAEALQLRSMLKDSERRSESAKEEVTSAQLEIQLKQRDLLSAIDMNNELELKSEDLKKTCVGLQNKICDLQKNLQELSDENNALSDANIAIKRSREEKVKKLDAVINTLEKENQSNLNGIRERDSKIRDLRNARMELERANEKATELNTNFSKEIEVLQVENTKLDAQVGEGKNTVVRLAEELQKCKAELADHKQITAAIYNMSARSMAVDQQQQRQN